MTPAEQARRIADALGGVPSGDGWKAPCPAHDDAHPSLSIAAGVDKVLVRCMAGCSQTVVLTALKERGLWSANGNGTARNKSGPPGADRQAPKDAWQPIVPVPPDAPEPDFLHPKLGKAKRHWRYEDANGATCFYVCRWDTPEGKRILPLAYGADVTGKPGWRWKGAPSPRPLYGLARLLQSPAVKVMVCEGEKAADAAQRLMPGIVAVTSAHGAGAAHLTDWTALQGRHVVAWPDNDTAGMKYAEDALRLAQTAGAATLEIIGVDPAKPEGWDAADALAEGLTAADLKAVLTRKPWTPPPSEPEKPEATATDADAAIAEMNKRHAFVWLGSKAAVLVEPKTPDGDPIFTTKQELAQAHVNKLVEVRSGNKVSLVSQFELWWKSPERREYARVTFLPGRDALPGEYNLWRGFSVKPAPGDCSLYLRLVEDAAGNGNPAITRYILDWMAHAVQRPWEKPGTALALPGGQGVGKGSIAVQFGRLFGPHFLQAESPDVLTGRFNLHLAHKVVLFADESFFSGDHRVAGILKARITEQELTFEGKGKDPVSFPNYWRIIAASNADWMVPAATDDRRWGVFRLSDKFKGDRDFWQAFHKQMNEGGRAALLHHLQERDLSGFIASNYPHTEARGEQIIASMEPLTAWWFERLQEGAPTGKAENWPDIVTCADVLEDATAFVQRHPRKVPVNRTNIGLILKRLCGLQTVQRWSNGSNRRVYPLPGLADCRATFEAATGFKTDWEPVTDDGADMTGWDTQEPARIS